MTYSTCTINSHENELLIRHILDAHPSMRLDRIDLPPGAIGLAGSGLSDAERSCVRRFDPADESTDTIGFFLAKLHKVLA
jgi:16S rRNA C967 or C1407 C5-methylase (RsmB/RsmF family)